MKKLWITFGGEAFDSSTQLIVERGLKFGADEIWVYDDIWLLNHPFWDLNKWLWEHPEKHRLGWLAWKPLIILDAMDKIQDGDIIMYTDADSIPIADVSKLYEICSREHMMLFENGRPQREWCKRDCYLVMAQDEERYHNEVAGVARFALFQKGYWRPQQFLMEWLTYAVNPVANAKTPSKLGPELPGFIEHRDEQAIMSLLAYRYGCRLYREADDASDGRSKDKDLYPTLFHQINPRGRVEMETTAEIKGSRFRNVEFYKG